MQRRNGLTLIEVLVAIFIMGIGLIALLTLFPIGILRMMQAIRDERTAQAAWSAQSVTTMHNLRNDPFLLSAPGEPDLFQNPHAAGGLLPSETFSESYPIYADPVGRTSFTGIPQNWVGGIPGYLRRCPVSFVPNVLALNQNFRIGDDITFDPTFDPLLPAMGPGTPKVIAPTGPPTIQRDPTYSWAYLLRRPQTGDRSVVDCAIVVYDKRATITMGETVYQNLAYFDPDKNAILIDISSPTTLPPNIRAGDWLYDATLYKNSPTTGSAHSYFYRVVAAEDVVAGGKRFAKYEVQTPIRGFISGPSKGTIPAMQDPTTTVPGSVYQGTVIVMDRVAEVFEKGPVRLP
jgi:prepilin-type N-terminal cleavage/methylation domain-containing protein